MATLPAAHDVALAGGVADNDPRVAGALAVSLSWARHTLCRLQSDALTDLDDYNVAAITGYAGDVLRRPQIQAALMVGEIDPAVVPLDVGRRWAAQLCAGAKHAWGIG